PGPAAGAPAPASRRRSVADWHPFEGIASWQLQVRDRGLKYRTQALPFPGAVSSLRLMNLRGGPLKSNEEVWHRGGPLLASWEAAAGSLQQAGYSLRANWAVRCETLWGR